MADTVDTRAVKTTGRRRILHLQNRSDGTGESAVNKLDISTLKTIRGDVCTYTVVDKIEYNVSKMSVRLDWDHDTDDEIVTLSGEGVIDWADFGGLIDPKTAGGTGDILLTTNGAIAGSTYDLTIYYRCKA